MTVSREKHPVIIIILQLVYGVSMLSLTISRTWEDLVFTSKPGDLRVDQSIMHIIVRDGILYLLLLMRYVSWNDPADDLFQV